MVYCALVEVKEDDKNGNYFPSILVLKLFSCSNPNNSISCAGYDHNVLGFVTKVLPYKKNMGTILRLVLNGAEAEVDLTKFLPFLCRPFSYMSHGSDQQNFFDKVWARSIFWIVDPARAADELNILSSIKVKSFVDAILGVPWKGSEGIFPTDYEQEKKNVDAERCYDWWDLGFCKETGFVYWMPEPKKGQTHSHTHGDLSLLVAQWAMVRSVVFCLV